jgi:flagellar biogenesis protein FliO
MFELSFKKRDVGQATSEYILLLAFVLILALLLANKFIKPMAEKLTNSVSQQIEKTLFGTDLHRLRIRR